MRAVWFVALSVFAGRVEAGPLRVVTTTQDPAALTRAIGGDRVEVTALAKGYQDPHFLDAKPSYMVLLNRADLVEIIGLDLEIGYIGALVAGAHNERIQPGKPGFLDLSTAIKPLEVGTSADRAGGDIHPSGNPHYWLDPENGRLMARAIAARLTELDPAGQATFAANLAAFERELATRMLDWQRRLEPLRGRPLVTFHRSWVYFTARFGLEVIDYVEPKPGVPPSPAHAMSLVKNIKARGVGAILMENFYDRRVAEVLADRAGVALVVVPNSVAGDDAATSYFALFDVITRALAEAKR